MSPAVKTVPDLWREWTEVAVRELEEVQLRLGKDLDACTNYLI